MSRSSSSSYSASRVRDRSKASSSKLSSRSSPSSTLRPSRSKALLRDDDLVADFKGLQISQDRNPNPNPNPNPRCFTHSVKQQCWERAEKVEGRDPDRWRRDALGNIVFRKLVGCSGPLCHDYDHILPYSKGGKSTLENCQLLQSTVNRSKGNRTEISKAELNQKCSNLRVSGRDMDILERSVYGNVSRGPDLGMKKKTTNAGTYGEYPRRGRRLGRG